MSDFNVPHIENAQPPRVRVRPATLSDAPRIAAVHVSSWEGAYRGMVPDEEIDRRTLAWRTEMWEELLGGEGDPAGRNRPWVALAEQPGAETERGTTIGFVSLGVARETPGSGEITALYVEPSAWRLGAGSALMQAALAQATERGCSTVTLWVLEPNLRARAFYERWGFADDGGRQTDREGWPVQLRMRRPTPVSAGAAAAG